MSDDAEALFERACALRDEERLEDARVAEYARQAVALRPKSE